MKISRRQAVQGLAATGAAAAVPATAAQTAVEPPPSVVIHDGRYSACAAFAAALTSPGVLVVDSHSRDIGLAWRDEIAAQLRARPGRVEGLSLYADRFICEVMARDLGLALTEWRIDAKPGERPGLFRWTLA